MVPFKSGGFLRVYRNKEQAAPEWEHHIISKVSKIARIIPARVNG